MVSGRTKTSPLIKGIFLLKGELYVTNAVKLKEHFNLYYIFKEDKERNQLQKIEALILWNNIKYAIRFCNEKGKNEHFYKNNKNLVNSCK